MAGVPRLDPSAIGYDNDGTAASASPRSHCPMVSQPSDADRPTMAQDAAHRSKGVTHARQGGRPAGCDRSGAVGCGVPIDLAEEGAELTHVGAVAKDHFGNVAQTEARLFL